MNKRFLFVFLSVFAILSCSQYIDLGSDKSEAYDESGIDNAPEDMEWDNDSESYNADKGDYGDTADSSDGYWDSGDTGGSEDSNADPEDYYADDEYDGSDEEPNAGETDNGNENAPTDDGLFPEGFSNAECDCGNEPDYHPICCDGTILVFNACFANCYAVKSKGGICAFYETGLCYDETGSDEEAGSGDDDNEQPDNDEDFSGISNKCGCYPDEKPEIFSCIPNNFVSYFISSCLAECYCDDPQKILK